MTKAYYETELGKLYHGDCLEILPLIDDKIDLILTDPPWNFKKDYGVYKDNLSTEDYDSLILRLKKQWGECGIEKYCIVLGSEVLKQWWPIFDYSKIIIVRVGAFVKSSKNNLRLQWKPIITNCKSNKLIYDIWNDIRWPGEGYFFNEPRYGHPAMTPLKLMSRCVNIFSMENDVIYEPFAGAGTTIVACEKLNRHWVGIEINKEYCDITVERIKRETAQYKMDLV